MDFVYFSMIPSSAHFSYLDAVDISAYKFATDDVHLIRVLRRINQPLSSIKQVLFRIVYDVKLSSDPSLRGL